MPALKADHGRFRSMMQSLVLWAIDNELVGEKFDRICVDHKHTLTQRYPYALLLCALGTSRLSPVFLNDLEFQYAEESYKLLVSKS